MSRGQYYDPWAKVGQSATDAVSKYLASRPNAHEVAMAQADLAAKNALVRKYESDTRRLNAESEINNTYKQSQTTQLDNRNNAPTGMADIFRSIIAPVEQPRPPALASMTPGMVAPGGAPLDPSGGIGESFGEMQGPMPGMAVPTDVRNKRLTESMPELFASAANYSSGKPSDLADTFMAMVSNMGGSGEQITNAQMGSGMDYANTQPGFEAGLQNNIAKGSGGLRNQKIYDAMRLFGVDESDATKHVDGYIKLSTDPLGNRTLTDTVSGLMDILQPQGFTNESQPFSEPVAPVSGSELNFDPGNATGMVATTKNFVSNTAGQFVDALKFEGPEDDAQKISFLERDLVKALSSSSRPPVIEQESIRSMIPQPFEFNQNPDVARNKVASVIDLMKQQYDFDAREVDNPMLPQKDKNELNRRMREIKRTISSFVKPGALSRLFPEVQGGTGQESGKQKEVGGRQYIQLDGKWFEQ